MKRVFFPALIVLVLLVVGVGFYRGWFALSGSNADKGSNKVNVNLTMDGDKFEEDAQTVKDKAVELTGQGTPGAAAPAPANP
jgi:hypothetical protein